MWKQPIGGGYASFVTARIGTRDLAFTIEQRGAQEVVAAEGRRPVRSDVVSNPALVPLGEVNSVGYDAQWAADNRARLVETWQDMVLDVQ